MSDIRIYTAANMPDSPLTGDVVLCSEEFNGAPANAVHLATIGGASPTWKSFTNDSAATPLFPNQYSLSFAASSSQYLSLGTDSSLRPASALTLSSWVYPTGSHVGTFPTIFTTGQSTIGGPGGFVLCIYQSKWTFYTYDAAWRSIVSDNTISNDQWSHVCVTWDGSVFKMFVNGAEQSQTLSYSSISYGTLESRIGSYGSDYFNGLIDECALWNSTALTSEQVASLRDTSGANPVPANISSLSPSAWWRMGDDSNDSAVDGGSVASITDSSGNGNTATQATASKQPTFSTSVPS